MSDPAAPRPLAICTDEVLLDDLIRLAAAVGTVLEVAPDLGAARRTWSLAPLVLVDADRAEVVADATPPRRRDVYLVGRARNGQGGADARAWQAAVRLGADDVLALPNQEERLVARMAEAVDGVSRDATVVGVIGGQGGAGASTLAVALAVTATRLGLATFLLDADPLGGGIDLLLAAEDSPGMRWTDLLTTRGRVNHSALRAALPRPPSPRLAGLGMLSWDRGEPLECPAEAMSAVLEAAWRGHDVVVIDLPRYVDAAIEAAVTRCTTVLMVVPADVRAIAAAGRVVARLTPLAPDVQVVVRRSKLLRLDSRTVAEALDLPCTGELDPEPGLGRILEGGVVPGHRRGPLAAFSQGFWRTRGCLDG